MKYLKRENDDEDGKIKTFNAWDGQNRLRNSGNLQNKRSGNYDSKIAVVVLFFDTEIVECDSFVLAAWIEALVVICSYKLPSTDTGIQYEMRGIAWFQRWKSISISYRIPYLAYHIEFLSYMALWMGILHQYYITRIIINPKTMNVYCFSFFPLYFPPFQSTHQQGTKPFFKFSVPSNFLNFLKWKLNNWKV